MIWKSQIAQTIPHEKKFAKILRLLFAAQEKEVLRNVQRLNLSHLVKKLFNDLEIKSDVDIAINKILFDKTKWDNKLVNGMLPTYNGMVSAAGKKVLTDLNLSLEFNTSDPEVVKFIKNKAIKFSGFVNGETAAGLNRVVRPILERVVQRGGTVEDVRERIQNAVKKRFDSSVRGTAPRARMIARTEMVGAANGGGLEAAKQSKVVKFKAWLTSKDLKVRDTHISAGIRYNKVKGIPIDKPFKVGTALLSVPGVAVGGINIAKEVINCRCTWIPVRSGVGKPPPGTATIDSVETPPPSEVFPNVDSAFNNLTKNSSMVTISNENYANDKMFYNKVFGSTEKDLEKQLKKVVDKSSIYMSIKSATLRKDILKKNGAFMNSLESKKGTFTIIGEDRAKKERWMFGIDAELDDFDSWPKYGFLSDSKKMGNENIVGFGYGDAFVKFKDAKVKNRSTFTMGDSFNGNRKREDIFSSIAPASKVTDPKVGTLKSYAKFPADSQVVRRIKDFDSIDKLAAVTEYPETQIYGKLTIADVENIAVSSKKTAALFTKDIKKLGVDVKVIPLDFDERMDYFTDYANIAIRHRASLSKADIARLGDDLIFDLDNEGRLLSLAKNTSWKPKGEMAELLKKGETIMGARLNRVDRRKLANLIAEEMPLKEKGGLPKIMWEDYRPKLSGWTDDIFNQDLLKKKSK
tara:strand:+ start:4692 stop:6764 length:2073 start_codon:yes stop_codon:yes gene_type:complete